MAVLLCTVCDHTFDSEDNLEESKCPKCSSLDCVYTSHINEGTRKRWVKIESSGPWFRNKKINRSLKDDVCKDELWTERMDNIVNEIFDKISNSNSDDFFPYYRVDYPRTFGKKRRLMRTDNAKKTKRGSIRGEMYESLFNKFVDRTENIERGLERVMTPDEEESCRPDAWVFFGTKKRLPLEFKTIAKGDWKLNKLKKMVIQSRKQGRIAQKAGMKNNRKGAKGMSILVVCCPEERNYTCFLFDERVEGRISHFKGVKSKKRKSREINKKRQREEREEKKRIERELELRNRKRLEREEIQRKVADFKRKHS